MLQKRSFSLSGHRTSIALEPEFWAALQAIADAQTLTMAVLIMRVDAARQLSHPLASALRVFVLISR